MKTARNSIALDWRGAASLATLGLLAGASGTAGRVQFLAAEADFFENNDFATALRHLVQRIDGRKDICIVNGHRPASADDAGFASFATSNHQRYALRHGYKYFGFEGRLSGQRFLNPEGGGVNERLGGGWNWQKLTALATVAQLVTPERQPLCRWMMWIDTDAIFSNPNIQIEGIISRYASNTGVATDVLLAQEDAGYAGDFINSGVMLVRNSWGGRAFIEGSAQTYERYKDRWLQDQDGIHDYVFKRDPLGMQPEERGLVVAHTLAGVVVTPQRVFDSFYWPDPPSHTQPSALWQACDFVGHLAGATPQQRIDGMRRMSEIGEQCPQSTVETTTPLRHRAHLAGRVEIISPRLNNEETT